MATYFPSTVVNLRLLFDEALTLSPDPPRSSVEDTLANRAPGGAGSFATPPTSVPGTAGRPLILQAGAFSYVNGRVPKVCDVTHPGYRQAGQFTLTFDFRELPLDPRAIRACAVSIHMGTVSADEFAKGMRNEATAGGLHSVLRTQTADGSIDEATLEQVGVADSISVHHGDNGSEITLRGRDLRGVLLDTPIDVLPKAQDQLLEQLDLSQNIVQVVRQILEFAGDLFSYVKVVSDRDEWLLVGGIPSPGEAAKAPRHRRGAKGDRKGKRGTAPGQGGGGRMSFWDLIVRMCFLVGAVPYFRNRTLVVRPVKGLYRQMGSGSPLDPGPFQERGRRFTGTRGTDADTGEAIPGGPLAVRRLAYGRDIKSFSFDRNLGGAQRPSVVCCVSHDSSSTARGTGKLLEARWPEREHNAARTTRVQPSGKGAQEEVLYYPVPDVTDMDQLREIARSLYEEIGRGEMGGHVDTPNLGSFGGDNADPDLVRIKPGDAVELVVDTRGLRTTPPLVSTLTDHHRVSFAAAVADITKRLGGGLEVADLARVIVATSRGQIAELQRYFRVSNVHKSWTTKGLAISFDFQNYVEVRAQVGEQVTGGDVSTTGTAQADSLTSEVVNQR